MSLVKYMILKSLNNSIFLSVQGKCDKAKLLSLILLKDFFKLQAVKQLYGLLLPSSKDTFE